MNLNELISTRIKMLGGKIDAAKLEYCIQKTLQEVRDFCNASEFGEDANIYIAEWAATNYLTEIDGYSKQWERMREDAERGLVKYRRSRW